MLVGVEWRFFVKHAVEPAEDIWRMNAKTASTVCMTQIGGSRLDLVQGRSVISTHYFPISGRFLKKKNRPRVFFMVARLCAMQLAKVVILFNMVYRFVDFCAGMQRINPFLHLYIRNCTKE